MAEFDVQGFDSDEENDGFPSLVEAVIMYNHQRERRSG